MATKYRFNGPALRRLIKQSGQPAELYALKLGKTKENVVGYMTGRINPPMPVAFALADMLGVDVNDLFAIAVDDMPVVAAKARKRTRKAQGLPAKVTDPAALDEAAQLLRREA